MSMPVLKLRQVVGFPGSVAATNGIDVTKANGTWTFTMDWSGFASTSALPTSPTNQVLSFDALTGLYVLVPTSLLGGGGGGGGVADAPSDGSYYGRLDATWAKVAPLASPTLTGTPTAPTAAPATSTTQIATTAFVAAAISSSGGVTPSALTKTDDANVTLTLGGTPATALLQATSITVGWSGVLSAMRGGFGANIAASSGVPLFATGAATFTATTGTGNFVRAVGPTFTGTPLAPTATAGTNTTQIATTAFVTAAVSSSGIADAPSDGTIYGRLNAGWAATVNKAGDTFTGNVEVVGAVTALGYKTRTGTSGAYGSNYFNISFSGTASLWIDATNLGVFAFTSDYRAKKDVIDLQPSWDAIKALRPIKYTQAEFSPPSHLKVGGEPLIPADNVERWGFIAHELQETLLASAATGVKDSPDTIQSPNPWPVIAALTKALQEAMARIEALEGAAA